VNFLCDDCFLSESGKLRIQPHIPKVFDLLDLYIIHCTESAEDIQRSVIQDIFHCLICKKALKWDYVNYVNTHIRLCMDTNLCSF